MAQAIAAALEPGVNVSALARRLRVSPPQLLAWRKAFLKRQNSGSVLGKPGAVLEIATVEVTIRVSAELNEAAPTRLLRAVRLA